jgi:competence ComEA-like helix-hairpin-helix protein
MTDQPGKLKEEDEGALDFSDTPAHENPINLVMQIEKALAEADPGQSHEDENSFAFPLSEAMALLPQQYIKQTDPSDLAGETIAIAPKELFKQLGRGKVEMPVSDLAYFIPLHLIYHAALEDQIPVTLPLKTVVRSLGLKVIKERTPRTIRLYDISEFDDPFTEGQASTEESAAVIIEDEAPATPPEASPAAETEKPAPAQTVTTKPEEENLLQTVPATPPPPPESKPPAEQDAIPAPTPVAAPVRSTEFEFPVAQALALMPPEYIANDALKSAGVATIKLNIPDLYDQLRHGKVRLTVQTLAGSLPSALVTDKALTDNTKTVELPLRFVIEAIGVAALKPQAAPPLRQYEIDRLADPFEEPKVLPKLQKAAKPARTAAHIEDSGTDALTAGRAVAQSEEHIATRVTTYTPSADISSELEFYELPGNVNINIASAGELFILPGVDRPTAEAIIAYREKHDGFKNIFELLKVQGVTPDRFGRMTGMKAGNKRRHRRNRLAELLKIPAHKIADLELTVKAISGRSGYSGCMISDNEGLILAQAGAGQVGIALSAVLPRMLRQVMHNMDLTDAGKIDTISLSIDGQLYTVASAPNMILTAIHAENVVSETEFSFIRKVSRELAWLLSFRAYAGPKA